MATRFPFDKGPQASHSVHTGLGVPVSGGEMDGLIRAMDWSGTPLGPVESWSPALRMAVRLMLANRFPMLLWWGPTFCSIYNDAYAPILGAKHPWALGRPVRECWSEIWDVLRPLIEAPFNGGPATWMEDILLEINRRGFVEETHFTIAYSPVPDEAVTSGIGGVLATVHEITGKVVGDRRVGILRDLGTRATEARTAEDACAVAAETLGRHAKDLPFALLYLIDPDHPQAYLAGAAGVAAGEAASPPIIGLEEGVADRPPWPLREALRREAPQTVEGLAEALAGQVPQGPWTDPPGTAAVVPIRSNKAHVLAGFLVAGISARLQWDEPYRDFLGLVASQIATAIANARQHAEEEKRAEALAEIDRALLSGSLEAVPLNEERLRFALETSHTGAWDLDLVDHSAFRSLEHDRVFGYERLLPRWTYEMFLDHVLAEDRAAVDAMFRTATATGRDWSFECRIRRADGEVRWIWAAGRHRVDAEGIPCRMAGIVQDITERKQAEEQVRINAERMAAVQEAQTVIATANADYAALLHIILETMARLTGAEGGCLEMIEGDELVYEAATGLAEPFLGLRLKMAESLSGLCATSGALLRSDDSELDPRVDRAACRRIGLRAMAVVPLRYGEDSFGVLKLMSPRVAAFGAAAEDTLRLMAEFLGATIARKRTQEALRESEERFANFMQRLPGLAWIKDIQGRYAYVNDAAEQAFRRPRAEIYGKADDEIFPAETAAQFRENDRKALATGAGVVTVETLEQDDGVLHHSVVSKFPLRDAEGRMKGTGGVAIDITERVQAEQRLQDATEKLREADRRKDEFLATLAHELRNPLAPIRTALEVFRKTVAPNPAADRLLGMMDRQMTHLVRLVDDLLEVSRITRGKIELRKERVDIAAVIGQAIDTSRPLIEDGHHALEVALPPVPLLVEADPVRLTQVFANLLNNAAKYTEPGGILRIEAQQRGNEAVVSVCDNGAGIAAELLPRVFDLFTQAHRGGGQAQGGLGIGLALVRHLVAMHGGTVTAHSGGPGRGSEFVVRLPVFAGSPKAGTILAQSGTPAPVAARRILVVDDNHDAADSLAELLALEGHETRAAYDGEEGVAVAADFRPDMILLDLGMPKMDGYAACRRLREQPWGRKATVVALTGWGQAEDHRKARAAGFDQHLVKPVDYDALTALIAGLPADGARPPAK